MLFYPLATILAGRVLGDQQRMARDIVALEKAKDELRLFKESMDSSSDAVGMATPDGRHFYQNEAFNHLFGRIGEDPPSSIYVDEQVGRDVFSSIMSGDAWTGEVEMRDARGEVRPIHLKAYAIRDEQGRIGGLVGIHSDISRQKQAQAERDQLQAQLLQAQKMESIGRLAGGVAHDFNNMLGVIIGHTDLALRHASPGQGVHDHLQEIGKAAHRSVDLTRQLLAFARKQTVSPQVLDLNETVKGMLKMLQRLIGENIELVWSPAPDPVTVRLDPSQLDQILANLAVNARDAIEGSGRLEIGTSRVYIGQEMALSFPDLGEGEYVLLTLRDSGCGMNEEVQKHLFEPFYTTKGLGKGTGLGLATIYGIINQNGGQIKIISSPGAGTDVRVFLPFHHGEPSRGEAGVDKEPVCGGRETVLLVEDELSILDMGRQMLEQLGYRVLCASGADEALRLAKAAEATIDLLLTDVIMPEQNGQELSLLLTKQRPELKVVFMSGYTSDIIASHGVLAPGIHYLQKPFRIEELALLLRRVLDDRSGDEPDFDGSSS
jgi:PAS domain S-box-containing protein